jgi:hypothetical protein
MINPSFPAGKQIGVWNCHTTSRNRKTIIFTYIACVPNWQCMICVLGRTYVSMEKSIWCAMSHDWLFVRFHDMTYLSVRVILEFWKTLPRTLPIVTSFISAVCWQIKQLVIFVWIRTYTPIEDSPQNYLIIQENLRSIPSSFSACNLLIFPYLWSSLNIQKSTGWPNLIHKKKML